MPCSGRRVNSVSFAEPETRKSFEAGVGTVKLTTVGPGVPRAPTWMCPAVTPLGRLKTSMTHETVRAVMLTVTVALPNAPVLMPGAGVSLAPLSDAVNVKVCAEAGAAARATTAGPPNHTALQPG